jgi:hypothetical protein
VGVQKATVRLAAVAGGEVIAERTVVHDHDLLLGELAAWPGARVCQEAGPTRFGQHPALIAGEVDSVASRRGWCPRGREIESKPIGVT